ncbi:MAG: hypothetical protein HY223_02435 [Thaumarchaeota archaeon]|nr:hypothetical protein [Nitrososphaerota archaeon]
MKNEKTTIPLLTGLAAIIISVILFSSTISQEIYALATPSSTDQNGVQQLIDSKEKISGIMANNPDVTTNAATISENGGIPIVGTFVDGRTLQLVVTVYDQAPLSLDVYEKRVRAIVGDIPLRVEFGNITWVNGGTNSCSSQTTNCNPVIGGLEIVNSQGGSSTLGLPLYNSLGTEGFIMASHAVSSTCGGVTGTTITQGGSNAGTVSINPAAGSSKKSDSAFVRINNGTQQFGYREIYASSNHYWYASSLVGSSSQSYGTTVAMQGKTSHYLTGSIVSIGTISISDCGNSAMQMMIASMTPAGGDSGSPVFTPADANGNVAYYGMTEIIYTSGNSHYNGYSPWDLIKSDLNVH